MIVVQFDIFTKNLGIIQLKDVNFMISKLYLTRCIF